jgi:hypothetical protein
MHICNIPSSVYKKEKEKKEGKKRKKKKGKKKNRTGMSWVAEGGMSQIICTLH